MIVGFIGSMGSGKTLSLTRQVYREYRKGKQIISNMHFNFPYTPLTIEMLLEYDQNDTPLHNCVLVVDEAHVYLDSRTSASKRNRIMSLFLTQTRKKNVHLYYTTQYYDQIDKRLRNNTECIVRCKKKEIFYKKSKFYLITNRYLIKEDCGFRTMVSRYVGNKFFSLYDTGEVISYQATT